MELMKSLQETMIKRNYVERTGNVIIIATFQGFEFV